MNELIARFGDAVKGVISGFDRIVFKGTVLPLAYAAGAMKFCSRRGILNKDYKKWMCEQSAAIVAAAELYAEANCGQGIVPIASSRTRKEQLAHVRQRAHGIGEGLIGVWSCLEAGTSYRARYCPELGFPQLRHYQTRCKHLYLYFDHADFGFMNIRLQTWFPYHVQVCMNGREWLRRSLQKEGIGFAIHGNKFLHIDDYAKAQQLLDSQLHTRWRNMLEGFLPMAFPDMRAILGPHLSYYWTVWQSEWATDLIFAAPGSIHPLMDSLLRHAFMTGTADRVLRYLDRPLTKAGNPRANCTNEVLSRTLQFGNGIRVRHWVDRNSAKVYNEQNVLRFETTINNPSMFRVYRRAKDEPQDAPKQLRPLRKSVADTALRARVSQEVNDRMMNDVAGFTDDTPAGELLKRHTRGWTRAGRRIRALQPAGKDRELLQAIADPAFALHGLTNKELRAKLKPTGWAAGRTEKQLAARISRHIRLLRDHGLLRKVPKRRRYHLTKPGRQTACTLNAMLNASTQQLMDLAA